MKKINSQLEIIANFINNVLRIKNLVIFVGIYGDCYNWLCCMNRYFTVLPLSPKSGFMRYA